MDMVMNQLDCGTTTVIIDTSASSTITSIEDALIALSNIHWDKNLFY